MTEDPVVSGDDAQHFKPPIIQDNATGWGPCDMPEQFKDMPYQPFSKGDRLGKISDWTGAAFQDKKYTSKFSSVPACAIELAQRSTDSQETIFPLNSISGALRVNRSRLQQSLL
ncbi:unnamed protein product [Timema podura]|uniref:Eukaryotic translation initiation factor 3 subunit p66 n=1 Tax=Timema podura TaxID=61482 RepID=A0ABN7P629_TIMPD|nr:unnamed protein product [Timema podura]